MSGLSCIPQMRTWIRENAPHHMQDVWLKALDTAEAAIEWHNATGATGGDPDARFANFVAATKELHEVVAELEEEMMT